MRQHLHTPVWVPLLALLVFVGSAAAQGSAQQGGASDAPINGPRSSKVTAIPIKISAGDLLDISVFDSPELTQTVRVGADGKVQLALLGSVAVGGLTAQEASEKIAAGFREGKLLLRPQVNVLVKEFASQGVSVSGEVAHPGVYQVLGPRTLLDVISMAGGLTGAADTKVTVKRRTGDEQKITVNLKNDDANASLANDVQVYPGDLVVVPRAGIVYVLGDVNRPGGFVMQNSGKITLLQALAQAGGTTATANVNGALLLRKSSSGYEVSKLQVGKIARGQAADVELSSDDVVFVPDKKLKTFLRNTQGIVASMGSASIYAVAH